MTTTDTTEAPPPGEAEIPATKPPCVTITMGDGSRWEIPLDAIRTISPEMPQDISYEVLVYLATRHIRWSQLKDYAVQVQSAGQIEEQDERDWRTGNHVITC